MVVFAISPFTSLLHRFMYLFIAAGSSGQPVC